VSVGSLRTKLRAQAASRPPGSGVPGGRQRAQVDQVLVGVAEGERRRRRRDVEDRPSLGREVQLRGAEDLQAVGRGGEGGRRHSVARDVLAPADGCLRRDRERALDDAQVAALARPQHQPVRAEPDGLAVAVGRPVHDAECRHARLRCCCPTHGRTWSPLRTKWGCRLSWPAVPRAARGCAVRDRSALCRTRADHSSVCRGSSDPVPIALRARRAGTTNAQGRLVERPAQTIQTDGGQRHH
jgi:hypothetical protein